MYLVLLILCAVEAIHDIKTNTIYTAMWCIAAIVGLIWNVVQNNRDFPWILLSSVIALFLLLCSKGLKGGIGVGDSLVFLALGLGLGLKETSNILFWSLLCCCCWGIIQVLCKKGKGSDELPFMPFVFIGMIWNRCMLYL